MCAMPTATLLATPIYSFTTVLGFCLIFICEYGDLFFLSYICQHNKIRLSPTNLDIFHVYQIQKEKIFIVEANFMKKLELHTVTDTARTD